MKNLKYYFKKAQKERWAIGQFNFSTLEQLKGIFEAAKEQQSPVILGTSEGESKFLGLEEISAVVRVLKKKHGVPAFLNLDHGKDLNWIKKSIACGYDAIHFDGSVFPFEENIKMAKEIRKITSKKGIFLEGEIDSIRGESKMHRGEAQISKEAFTLPEKALKFIREAKIDSLAIFIGNVHGVYEIMPQLDFDLLEKIKKISSVFLVLHGGSGIPDIEIKKAVDLGINKVNFNTEIRAVWRQSLERSLKESPEEMKPYKILSSAQDEVKKKVAEKIILLKSQNKI
jgi:fructose-bisphosphate aldolase class II